MIYFSLFFWTVASSHEIIGDRWQAARRADLLFTQQLFFEIEADETIIMNDAFRPPQQKPGVQQEPVKVSGLVQIACAWPLLLIAIGGLIGGALGGAAYGINLSIYKSQLPLAAKIILNIVTGVGAIVIWLAIAIAINSARQ